jgi:hypothetical protein
LFLRSTRIVQAFRIHSIFSRICCLWKPMNLWAPHRHRAREKAKPHLVSVSFICLFGFEGVAFGV